VPVSRIGQALRGLAQRLGGTRLGVRAIGRIVSPLQRQLYCRSGGRLSLTGRAPVLLLTTTGRRTGKARTVPLLYLRDGDRLVICNVNPGFERPNPWVVNLRAQPHARVQIGRGTASMSARPASDDELDRYWPQLTKVWPAYQAFYDKGGKRSVFVLEPDGPSSTGRPGNFGAVHNAQRDRVLCLVGKPAQRVLRPCDRGGGIFTGAATVTARGQQRPSCFGVLLPGLRHARPDRTL
jgi:deazaflavin-dependent oxidoreductase (nitroreductase family)